MKMMMWDNFRAVKKIIIFICWQWQLKMVSTGVETSKTKIYFYFQQEKNVTDAKKYIVIVTYDVLVNNFFS